MTSNEERDTAFTVEGTTVTFGRGALAEVGPQAAALGLGRVAVLTDPVVSGLEHFDIAVRSLRRSGIDVVTFTDVVCEPTDTSFAQAAAFAADAEVDGFVSVGGGSVIDTTKAANLFSTYPAGLLRYVNAPIGEGAPPPGPLKPHIACPTTCGTGSEATGIAVFDYVTMHAKTGIASRRLRPTMAIVDPATCDTLPGPVVASTGFDVLSHAVESYTARPFTGRPAPPTPPQRPMSQGANPWSDVGAREAIRLVGSNLRNAVSSSDATQARENLMWAATLAGIAFGNAGCHAPHALSYSVAGLAARFDSDGRPMAGTGVPHGFSVVVTAPAVFRYIGATNLSRHGEVAQLIDPTLDFDAADAGDAVAAAFVALMQDTDAPRGLTTLGYTETDITALVDGAYPQQRLLANAPLVLARSDIAQIYRDSLQIW